LVARGRDQAIEGRAVTNTAGSAQTFGARTWLLRDLPYAAMLALALGGIVLTGFRAPRRITTGWRWRSLLLITVISGWRRIETASERLQLVLTQVLHWAAFVIAMWLMFLPEVRAS